MTQELIERLRCNETPPGSTRSRLRSRCFPKTGGQAGAYTSSQRGVAKYVRAATARGTRRRGYFAAAVAARSRSRQAIMAAFLQIPLRQYRAPLCPLCLSLSLFLFFPSLSPSLPRRFLSLRVSSLYRGPFPCSVSVASFQFSLGFSKPPSLVPRPGALAGMRRSGVAVVVVVPH